MEHSEKVETRNKQHWLARNLGGKTMITQNDLMQMRFGWDARDAGRKRKGPSWVDVLLAVSLFVAVCWIGRGCGVAL